MQIQYNGGRIVHIDNQIGRDLIARKLAVEVIPSIVKPGVMTFGILQSDLLTPPAITYSCSGQCGSKGFIESAKGTAHQNPVYHCGTKSLPGPDVADAYIRAFNSYSRATSAQDEAPKPKRVFFANAIGAR